MRHVDLFDSSEIETGPKDRRRRAGSRTFDSKITVRKAVAGWQLCTDGACGVLPAGGRLLRGKPWPIDRFIFDTEEEAREAAEKLAAYLGTDVTPHQFSSIDLHDPA